MHFAKSVFSADTFSTSVLRRKVVLKETTLVNKCVAFGIYATDSGVARHSNVDEAVTMLKDVRKKC